MNSRTRENILGAENWIQELGRRFREQTNEFRNSGEYSRSKQLNSGSRENIREQTTEFRNSEEDSGSRKLKSGSRENIFGADNWIYLSSFTPSGVWNLLNQLTRDRSFLTIPLQLLTCNSHNHNFYKSWIFSHFWWKMGRKSLLQIPDSLRQIALKKIFFSRIPSIFFPITSSEQSELSPVSFLCQ